MVVSGERCLKAISEERVLVMCNWVLSLYDWLCGVSVKVCDSSGRLRDELIVVLLIVV